MSQHDINPFEEATRAPAYSPPAQPAPAADPQPQYGSPSNGGGYSEGTYQAPSPAKEPAAQPEFFEGGTGNTGYAGSTAYNPDQPQQQQYAPPGYNYGQAQALPSGDADPRTEGQQPQGSQPPPARDLGTSKFWTLAFYQQFFEVDTNDVLRRMANTLVPTAPPDFLLFRRWHANQANPGIAVQTDPNAADTAVERMPDVYGPFWVTTTLWMALAIVGNMMSKLSHSHAVANKKPNVDPEWTYDFTVASVACATIYIYCGCMSLLVWGLMKWKAVPVTLLDTLALYGYSMFLWLLAAILCMIPVVWAQWLICLVAGVWSTAYLLLNLWHVWKAKLEGPWFIGIVLLVSVFHMAMTLSFKFYFLNYEI